MEVRDLPILVNSASFVPFFFPHIKFWFPLDSLKCHFRKSCFLFCKMTHVEKLFCCHWH